MWIGEMWITRMRIGERRNEIRPYGEKQQINMAIGVRLYFMNKKIIDKIIQVCEQKIAAKGEDVGLSFYAFFENKNTDPELLLEVATWWIKTNKFDHFEKAVKIKNASVNANI